MGHSALYSERSTSAADCFGGGSVSDKLLRAEILQSHDCSKSSNRFYARRVSTLHAHVHLPCVVPVRFSSHLWLLHLPRSKMHLSGIILTGYRPVVAKAGIASATSGSSLDTRGGMLYPLGAGFLWFDPVPSRGAVPSIPCSVSGDGAALGSPSQVQR